MADKASFHEGRERRQVGFAPFVFLGGGVLMNATRSRRKPAARLAWRKRTLVHPTLGERETWSSRPAGYQIDRFAEATGQFVAYCFQAPNHIDGRLRNRAISLGRRRSLRLAKRLCDRHMRRAKG
jgi:hypothetical protein